MAKRRGDAGVTAVPGLRSGGWQRLGFVWAAVLLLAAGAAAALQYLGPVPRPEASALAGALPNLLAEKAPANPAHATGQPPPAALHPVPVPRVAAPEPALLEPSGAFPPALLPRVATDGRLARIVYAGPAPTVEPGQKRVALLLSGFGLSERDSREALEQLPGPVSFAVSAYADQPALLDVARAAGHELLASVPMEPQGYPLNDEGVHSMRTGLTREQNMKMLEWALGRTAGAVGATGASDGMKGERFADVSAAIDPALDEIERRGLLYIDPRPGRFTTRAGLPARPVDVVLDEAPGRAEIEGKLLTLERVAREQGSAIGLAGPLRPVTVERIAAWTKTLGQKGLVLVPVSTLVEKR